VSAGKEAGEECQSSVFAFDLDTLVFQFPWFEMG